MELALVLTSEAEPQLVRRSVGRKGSHTAGMQTSETTLQSSAWTPEEGATMADSKEVTAHLILHSSGPP